MLSSDEIRSNFAHVNARVAAACARSGRRVEDVTLVAVTKTFPAEAVQSVIAAGAANVGENRVQEGRDKKPLVSSSARWHLIGHLQSNKAREAVRLFDVIQTIDSVELAQKVAAAAAKEEARQEVMIEVNIGREPQKDGADPADVPTLVDALRGMVEIHLIGLMAIPPHGEPEATRPWFRALRELRDRVGLVHLSMGMTEDFEVAIEEGSTIVRVGRAIFGSRV